MGIRIFFGFHFLFLFFSHGRSIKFTIVNHCPYTIWPASLTSKGPQITTGFELASHASRAIDVDRSWSGRVWARFVCSHSGGGGGGFRCRSGDCASNQIECHGRGGVPPATLAEFTLSGDGGKDSYDISLVDGFNLPITVAPQSSGCGTVSCPVDINNRGCPKELSIYNTDGGVIGCKSACLAFQQPQYCCTGEFGTPDKCKPTGYSQIFKNQCPQAYSYAFDDPSSLVTCKGHPNYVITFCP